MAVGRTRGVPARVRPVYQLKENSVAFVLAVTSREVFVLSDGKIGWALTCYFKVIA